MRSLNPRNNVARLRFVLKNEACGPIHRNPPKVALPTAAGHWGDIFQVHSLSVALSSLAFTPWPWQFPAPFCKVPAELGYHSFSDPFPFFWLADHCPGRKR